MNGKELILERLHRNGLLNPFDSISDCVYSLSGIQSQLQQFAEVSIFNRCSKSPKQKEFQRLYDSHGILNLWGQRHTLHMYVPEDWDMISDVFHDKFVFKRYADRFSSELTEMIATIESEGIERTYIDRGRITEILHSKIGDVLSEEDYLDYMLLRNSCIQGAIFGVPAKPSIKHFGSYTAIGKERWTRNEEHAETSLDELMRRYFQYYGPASVQDFCHWSGLTLSVANNAFFRIESELEVKEMNGRKYYSYGNIEMTNSKRLFLLGKFDPLFVSYKHKEWIVTKEQEKAIWRSPAIIESVILDGTSVLGTWRHSLKGKGMSVNITPLTKISAGAEKRIEKSAKRLALFWERQLDGITYLE